MDKDNLRNPSILDSSIRYYPNIEWKLLAQAQEYYSQFYLYQETPFLVPEEYSRETKPHNDRSFVLTQHLFEKQPQELVGSAEQGFIYLAQNNFLLAERLFSISPCFRTERYDSWHQPWFMKLELFHLSSDINDVESMINHALAFYQSLSEGEYSIIQTSEKSWDINLNHIEIGSYGLRELSNLSFIYGTGLALPRFSQAREHLG